MYCDTLNGARYRTLEVAVRLSDGGAVPPICDVATRAGVAPATIHHYFGSRDELLAAADDVRTLGGNDPAIARWLVEHPFTPRPRGNAPQGRRSVRVAEVEGVPCGKRQHRSPAGKVYYCRKPCDATCEECGGPFHRHRERQVTCRSECQHAWEKRTRARKLPGPRCKYPSCDKRVDTACEVCGTLFHQHWNDRPDGRRVLAVTCSRTCGGQLVRTRTAAREPMTPTEQMYAYNRRTGSWPQTAVRFLDCGWCGTPFLSRYGALLCGKECRRRYGSRYTSNRIMERYHSDPEFRAQVISGALNRRASLLGLEEITQPRDLTLYLLERDGNVCGICGGTVIDEGGPRQPSVDHIIPLAKGGAHGPGDGNLQLAHLDCNLRKNDKVIPSVLGYPGEYAAAS